MLIDPQFKLKVFVSKVVGNTKDTNLPAGRQGTTMNTKNKKKLKIKDQNIQLSAPKSPEGDFGIITKFEKQNDSNEAISIIHSIIASFLSPFLGI